MVKAALVIERDGKVLQQDWIEITDNDYTAFERRLWGWGTANFILYLVDRMVTGLGMIKLTPQRYADKARVSMEHP